MYVFLNFHCEKYENFATEILFTLTAVKLKKLFFSFTANNVWEDVSEDCQEFIKEYLQEYPVVCIHE